MVHGVRELPAYYPYPNRFYFSVGQTTIVHLQTSLPWAPQPSRPSQLRPVSLSSQRCSCSSHAKQLPKSNPKGTKRRQVLTVFSTEHRLFVRSTNEALILPKWPNETAGTNRLGSINPPCSERAQAVLTAFLGYKPKGSSGGLGRSVRGIGHLHRNGHVTVDGPSCPRPRSGNPAWLPRPPFKALGAAWWQCPTCHSRQPENPSNRLKKKNTKKAECNMPAKLACTRSVIPLTTESCRLQTCLNMLQPD